MSSSFDSEFTSDFAGPNIGPPSILTGPPYPPPPQPGSNEIGVFRVGVSPVGTISSFDVWATILSQYSNSPVMDALLTSFASAVDMTENFDDFYDWMWNVATAQGYGLDVWGRIVGVSRILQLPEGSPDYVGFQEAGDSNATGWNQAPWFSGGTLTSSIVLGDSDFRTLIYAKAASNICDGATPSINSILLGLFPGRGPCYVTDNQNMTISYTFSFVLTPVELQLAGVLPTPVGVSANVVQP
jgi:hypothetical protein